MLRNVELQRHGLAPQSGDIRDHPGGLRRIAAIGDDDIATMAGDGKGGVAAKAAVRAGDLCDLSNTVFLLSSG